MFDENSKHRSERERQREIDNSLLMFTGPQGVRRAQKGVFLSIFTFVSLFMCMMRWRRDMPQNVVPILRGLEKIQLDKGKTS